MVEVSVRAAGAAPSGSVWANDVVAESATKANAPAALKILNAMQLLLLFLTWMKMRLSFRHAEPSGGAPGRVRS